MGLNKGAACGRLIEGLLMGCECTALGLEACMSAGSATAEVHTFVQLNALL